MSSPKSSNKYSLNILNGHHFPKKHSFLLNSLVSNLPHFNNNLLHYTLWWKKLNSHHCFLVRNNCVFDIFSNNFHSLLLNKIVLRFEIVSLYNFLLAGECLGSSHCFLVLQLSPSKLIKIPPDSCVLLVFTDIVSLALSHSFHIQPFLLFHFSFFHKVVRILFCVDHLLNSEFDSLLMLNGIPSDSVEDIGFLG